MQKTVKSRKPRFSFIQPIDRTLIRCYHSGPQWTWEQWQWRGTLHSPKLQHHWNLTIRLFIVISRTLVGGGSYSSAEKQSMNSTAPADWAIWDLWKLKRIPTFYIKNKESYHTCMNIINETSIYKYSFLSLILINNFNSHNKMGLKLKLK